jgi:hypothetical protein
MMRKSLYKKSPEKSMAEFRYLEPVIEYNHNRTVRDLGVPSGGCHFPTWLDERMLALCGEHSGSITHGLPRELIYKAAISNHFAANPYYSYATGGYRFINHWRSTRIAGSEQVEFARILASSIISDKHKVYRYDEMWPLESAPDLKFGSYSFNQIKEMLEPPPWRKRKRYATSSLRTRRYVPRARYEYKPVSPQIGAFEEFQGPHSPFSELEEIRSVTPIDWDNVSLPPLDGVEEQEDAMLYLDVEDVDFE